MSYSSEVLADSPLAYYRLGESSGTTMTDSSGNGRDGVYTNGPTLGVAGLLVGDGDTAVAFSFGSAQSGDIAWAAWQNVTSLTLEAWIKTTSSGIRSVWDRDDLFVARPWQMRMNSGKLEFIRITNAAGSISVVTLTGAVTVNDGLSHHVAVTYDGTTIRLYVDGIADGTALVGDGLQQPGTSARLSVAVNRSDGGGGTAFFDGTIDEAAYYGAALSAGRIAAHYTAGTMVASTDLTLVGVVPPVTGAFAMDSSLDLTLNGVVPAVTGSFALTSTGISNEVALVGVIPPITGAFSLASELDMTLAGVLPPITGAFALDDGTAPPVLGSSQAVRWLGGSGWPKTVPKMGLLILDPVLDQAPTSVTVVVDDARSGEDIVFRIDGLDGGVVFTATADSDGYLGPTSLPVSEAHGAIGDHVLSAHSNGRAPATAIFVMERAPSAAPADQGPDAHPVAVPGATSPTGVQRWVLQDLLPGGIGSWVMPINPTSQTSMYARRTVTPLSSTSPTGAVHFYAGNIPPMDFQFAGYCPDQDFHDHLLDYADLPRRFYLIDHRNRAWKVAFTKVDLVARKRQREESGFNDWAHNYTVYGVCYNPVWLTPDD